MKDIVTGEAVDSVELRQQMFANSRGFSPAVMDAAKFQLCRDVVDQMLYEMRVFVWAEDLGENIQVVAVEQPADWWQHFKERWFPAWLLRRFPVRMEKFPHPVKVEAFAVYPKLPMALRGHTAKVDYAVHYYAEDGL